MQRLVKPPKRGWRAYLTFTNLFIAIQVLVYLAMEIYGSSTDNLTLFVFGAKYNLAIKLGQYWRLITPMFLHIGFEHLVFNSIFLYFIGNDVEDDIGSLRFLVLYLTTGLMGNLASFAFSSALSAGSSTAIFGLLGAVVYLFIKHENIRDFREYGMRYGFLLAMNLFSTFTDSSIDLWGHLGGLVGGLMMTQCLSYRGDPARAWFNRALGLGGYLVLGIFLFTLGMRGTFNLY